MPVSDADAETPPTRMWGTSLRQRLRLMPLYAAITLADLVAPLIPGGTSPRAPWLPGISVVIPERDAPALLRTALRTLYVALAHVGEAHEVVVVVNGAALEKYAAIAQEWPALRFLHHDAPLGFTSAIALGLAHVRQPGTLLLNNDMQLAPEAI